MKIRTRVIIITAVTAMCLCSILIAISGAVLSRSFTRIENDQMRQNLNRIQFAIDREEITLSNMAAGYATWDETCQFVEDGNTNYIQNYFIGPTFVNADANLFAVINNSGVIVHAEYYDLQHGVEIPLSEETLTAISNSYLLSRNADRGKFGIVATAQGPLLFGARPILTSQGLGPVRGTVIMGKFLDDQLINKLSIMTKLSITFNPFSGNASSNADAVPALSPQNPILIKPLNSDTLAGYYLLPDIYGQPCLVTETQTSRDVYAEGKNAILWLIICIALTGIIITLVNVRFLDRLVLSRLRILSSFAGQISRKGDLTARVSLDGQDELTALGGEMNAMLARLFSVNEQLSDSEKRYSTLVENSSDGIILVDDNIVTYANPRMLQMLGLTEQEFLGSPCLGFVNEEYKNMARAQRQLMLSGKPYEGSYEIEINRKSGASFPVEIRAKDIKLNRIDYTMVVFRDITERKQTEKQLEEAFEKEKAFRLELEEEAKTRTQFINVLAHELRNPLTPIQASLEMGRDSLAADTQNVQYRLFKNALEGVYLLRNRLEELLDMVRFSRGGFTLNLCPVNTGDFLKKVALRYNPALEKKQQKLIIDIPENLPRIIADPSRLEQVIINLLSNASKYSQENTEITLEASVASQGIQVEVKDQGIGIPPGELENIFKPYHRTDQTRQRYSGIGLGLVVCKQIIEAHQGLIWIESEVGKGSAFKFTLPLKPV